MLNERNDNKIFIPIKDKKTGDAVNPADFVQATYQVSTLGGQVLFQATKDDHIDIQGMEFVVTIPAAQCDYTGPTFHEMLVVDAQGNRSTILQTQQTFNDTRI